MRYPAAVLAALAACAVVAGCSTSPSTTNPSHPKPQACATRPPKTVPDAYLIAGGLMTPTQFAQVFPHAHSLAASQADLVGPHSALQIVSVTTLTSLNGAQACALDLPRPERAPAGHQLVLALLNDSADSQPSPGLPECTSDNTPPAACSDYPEPAIVAAGHSTAMDKIPQATGVDSDVLVASVPDGAPVDLQMNDGNRPQDLDLRTGLRTREASSLYYPVPQQSITQRLDADWNALYIPALKWYGNDISTSLYDGIAILAPYTDQQGWAPPGHAWLVLTFVMDLSPSNWKLAVDVPHSFTLHLPGSRMVTTGSVMITSANTQLPGNVSLTFEVPDSARSATLVWTPTGTVYPSDHITPAHLPVATPSGTRKMAILLRTGG